MTCPCGGTYTYDTVTCEVGGYVMTRPWSDDYCDHCGRTPEEVSAVYEEWLDEPLRKEWEACGLPCVLLRENVLDVWHGYVGVGRDHPAYGDASVHHKLDVHGGMWVSFFGSGGKLSNDHYWFAFDCGHLGDVRPSRVDDPLFGPGPFDRYRDIDYATREAERLAAQLAAMVTPEESQVK